MVIEAKEIDLISQIQTVKRRKIVRGNIKAEMRDYNIAELRRKRPDSPASSMMIEFDINIRQASMASIMMDGKKVRAQFRLYAPA